MMRRNRVVLFPRGRGLRRRIQRRCHRRAVGDFEQVAVNVRFVWGIDRQRRRAGREGKAKENEMEFAHGKSGQRLLVHQTPGTVK